MAKNPIAEPREIRHSQDVDTGTLGDYTENSEYLEVQVVKLVLVFESFYLFAY